MDSNEVIEIEIPDSLRGARLDQALAELLPQFSRARLQRWIKEGKVTAAGAELRAKDKVAGGERLTVRPEAEIEVPWQAQSLPLDVVYEDEAILVINKPAGLVVHPGAGNLAGTLVNALLHHAPELERVPRAGIVHRLDKDTTGLLVVARSLPAHTALVEQLQARTVTREYEAVIVGTPVAGGTIEAPIARHPADRTRMAVVSGGRPAVSHYRIRERFAAHAWINVNLETGRTHQIRVHMAHLAFPLVGDPVYAGRARPIAGASPPLAEALRGFKRQALHAGHLALDHPLSGEPRAWRVPLPPDMEALLAILRADTRERG